MNGHCKFNSVGKDIALYIQRKKFESQTTHLFALRCEFLSARLLEKKHIMNEHKLKLDIYVHS